MSNTSQVLITWLTFCLERSNATISEITTRYLLLISCSATKRHDPGLLPASQRYQGVVYRVIRKNRPDRLSVWIISAEFGLIHETCPIPDYDRAMTHERACELEQSVSQELDRRLRTEHFAAIFVNLGARYARALNASVLLPQMRAMGVVEEARGGIGSRLRQTKQWLVARAIHPSPPSNQDAERPPKC
jgi:hypothetical protein